VFADEANFETRPKRWFYGCPDLGRDLSGDVAVEKSRAQRIDASLETVIGSVVDGISSGSDLATEFAARLPLELWGHVLDIGGEDLIAFAARYWRMQRGFGWNTEAQHDALNAFRELERMVEPLMVQRRGTDAADLITTIANLDLAGPETTAADVVATILEPDHETLHGGLANLWFLLLTNPAQLEIAKQDPRLMKFAWLETLRHSPPVESAQRFARHEVERFGRLIPEGGLLHCSAAAANRDPRQFVDADIFLVDRKDICQREPRGQYRADGLPSGIAFGLGKPSVHPADPRERPRSMYAITRDVAVAASHALLETHPDIALAQGTTPVLRNLRIGEMRTCWALIVTA
jgi:pulcherriminic acid synthase